MKAVNLCRDFVHGVVPVEEYILGRECFWRIVRKHIVENRRPPNGDSFLPYFVAAKGGEGSDGILSSPHRAVIVVSESCRTLI